MKMNQNDTESRRRAAKGVLAKTPATKAFLGVALPLVAALWFFVGCSQKPSGSGPAKPQGKPKLGYVLHGLNDFTQIIKQGAEDAARAEGVIVDVVGPASF